MTTETIETLICLRNKMLALGLTVAAEIIHDELTNDHGESQPPAGQSLHAIRDQHRAFLPRTPNTSLPLPYDEIGGMPYSGGGD